MRTLFTDYPKVLSKCIRHATQRYAVAEGKDPHICDVKMWEQMWSDSSCGFPSALAMQASWRTPTVLIQMESGAHDLYYIYHNSRFAYELKGAPTIQFRDCLTNHRFPGVRELDKHLLIEHVRHAQV